MDHQKFQITTWLFGTLIFIVMRTPGEFVEAAETRSGTDCGVTSTRKASGTAKDGRWISERRVSPMDHQVKERCKAFFLFL